MPQTLAPPWPGDDSYGSSFQFAVLFPGVRAIPIEPSLLLAFMQPEQSSASSREGWDMDLLAAPGSRPPTDRYGPSGTEIEIVGPTEVIELK